LIQSTIKELTFHCNIILLSLSFYSLCDHYPRGFLPTKWWATVICASDIGLGQWIWREKRV